MGGVNLASLISLIVKWLREVEMCTIKRSIFPDECLGSQNVLNKGAQCNNI
jgi:hypothetical protein